MTATAQVAVQKRPTRRQLADRAMLAVALENRWLRGTARAAGFSYWQMLMKEARVTLWAILKREQRTGT